jgi:signal transduction histidine kinase
MAAGPAATALILSGITAALVPGITVNGSAYKQIIAGKDFEATAGAPTLYIIEIDNDVQRLLNRGGKGTESDGLRADVTSREAAYERTYQQWVDALKDPAARNDLVTSHRAAQQYFDVYQGTFLPALKAGHYGDANRAVQGPMSSALSTHRTAAQSAAGRISAQVHAQESAASAQAIRQLLGVLGVTLLIVSASIALGITVLRSITDRVSRLTEVATVELPQVLEEVKRAALAGEEIPTLPDPGTDGGDELASAARAFNAVVATAVGLAADQSRMRRATSQMFVNLGRRNHKLLSRTLTYITQLESDERDPNTLQNLFRLDHLTTRMRRHAESLLVLAGSPPLRTWSRPVPVADVLRAALSEIETYDRVDIKELEPVEVRGASVSDLAHLLAELLENATAFSPPQTRVRVLGRTDAEGYTIVVVDEGIGMSAQELGVANELIGTSESSGLLGDSRMLGLGVVGRLAARHGFKVNLTASPVGGVVAWVALPTAALAPRRGAGDGETSAAPNDVVPSFPTSAAAAAAAVAAVTAAARGSDRTDEATSDEAASDEATGAAAGAKGASNGRASEGVAANTADAVSGANGAQARTPGPGSPRTGSAPSLPPTALPLRRATDQDDVRARTEASGSPVGRQLPAAAGPSGPAHATSSDADAVPAPAARNGSRPTPERSAPRAGAPGSGGGLKRRIRGAQMPDTGEDAAGPHAPPPERTAQSVRGALASFNAGRRSAEEATHTGSLSTGAINLAAAGAAPVLGPAHAERPPAAAAVPEPLVVPVGESGALPRRVRGAQLPETDLPSTTEPAPERSAAEVRAALSNFVAGRRAAEHDH